MIVKSNSELVLSSTVGFPPTGGVSNRPLRSNIVKAHQRLIREQQALEFDPLIGEKMRLASSLKNAWVKEIDRKTAEEVILRYEWLGNMGVTDYQFGLYFGEYLAGVVCFGRTAGTKTVSSICGEGYAHLVKTLNRGACVHWAHPHSASFLISRACRLMTQKGFHIFVAYSDTEAGEIGTVYQASNWLYCGTTGNPSSMFVWAGRPLKGGSGVDCFKDGKPRDERCIQHMTRVRTETSKAYRTLMSRRELRVQLVDGFVFYKTAPKHRYVTFCGDKETVDRLRASLKWTVNPYPKRSVYM
jgi:hypothetical protein